LFIASACSFHEGVLVDANVSAELDAWPYKRELTINNMGLAAHADFALMVALDSSRVRYSTQGADLRFTDANATMVLPHEIDRWNTAGRSIVWVRVPAIAANATTTLWMYYGNAAAASAERPTDVWDQNYVGVWHLTDAHDSAGHNSSASNGAVPIDGPVGGAVRVFGQQYIDTGAADQLATFTIEVWLNAALPATTSNSSGPLSRGYNYQMQWNCGDIQYCRSVNLVDQSGTVIAQYGNTLAAGTWHHVTARYDGSVLETYVGDTRTGTATAAGPPVAETGTAKLGARVNLAGYYSGDIDEARISRVARSGDYLKAQHRAQTDTYLTFGPEQPNP